MIRSRLVAAAAFVSVSTFLSGCPQGAGGICQRSVDSIDALYQRCGYHLQFVITFDGVTASDCGHATHSSDGGDSLLHHCIPWTTSVDCASLVLDAHGNPVLDPSCNFRTLSGRP